MWPMRTTPRWATVWDRTVPAGLAKRPGSVESDRAGLRIDDARGQRVRGSGSEHPPLEHPLAVVPTLPAHGVPVGGSASGSSASAALLAVHVVDGLVLDQSG